MLSVGLLLSLQQKRSQGIEHPQSLSCDMISRVSINVVPPFSLCWSKQGRELLVDTFLLWLYSAEPSTYHLSSSKH